MERAEREAVLAQIHEEELVELARALVRIPSVVRADGSGDEREVAHFVATGMRELGFEVALEEVHPGRPNVIGTLKGSAPGRTILFEAHSDVVMASRRITSSASRKRGLCEPSSASRSWSGRRSRGSGSIATWASPASPRPSCGPRSRASPN